MTTVRLPDDQLEQLAGLIAERINGQDAGVDLIDAAKLAARLGRSRDYVYEHANELGAIRLGNGPKPRLIFPWPLPSLDLPQSTSPPAQSTTKRRRSTATVELLPIKGSRQP